VLSIGGSGSGKTSSVLRTFQRAYLRRGMGGIFFCTKPDDRPMIERWLRETGRSDYKIFGVGQSQFDPLAYHTAHRTASVRNRAEITESLEEMVRGALGTVAGEEYFWKLNRHALLTSLLAVAMHSGEPVTFKRLRELLKSAPRDLDEVDAGDYRKTVLGRCLILGEVRTSGTPDAEDFQNAKEYFLKEYPDCPQTTREGFTKGVEGMLRAFADPDAKRLTSSLDLKPEDALAGRIIIVDLPDSIVGRMLTLGFKHLFQKAALRRSVPADDDQTIPAFLTIDEFQAWITKQDAPFLARARPRSNRGARGAHPRIEEHIEAGATATGGPLAVAAICGGEDFHSPDG
jgi:hypothetical protein